MHEFLNSKFALFLMGSVALPAILAFWEYLKTRATRRNVKDRLARLAIWRYTLVEDGCKGDHPGFLHAFDVLRGGIEYRRLDPREIGNRGRSSDLRFTKLDLFVTCWTCLEKPA
ncbi:hypothetical protein D1BOALGB6SA_9796 [Olavius sp. associated proteobacterium Delta 1]|nr:hypothetical protein D1BOALGB6SA_9796 [Olavius sp. associated proteobacterium Delta 1]